MLPKASLLQASTAEMRPTLLSEQALVLLFLILNFSEILDDALLEMLRKKLLISFFLNIL